MLNPAQARMNNIRNLIAFWRLCGAAEQGGVEGVERSIAWPHRVWWAQPDDVPSTASLTGMVSRPEQLLPVWPGHERVLRGALASAGLRARLQQTLMSRGLSGDEVLPVANLQVRSVRSDRDAREWAAVAAAAFGYSVDEAVTERLWRTPDCVLLLGLLDENVVGTGLIVQSEGTAGLHMLGVVPAERRKGFARSLMTTLLAEAQAMGSKDLALQASVSGEPLYREMGFQPLGTLSSYGL